MRVLALNSGSSSLKFKLVDIGEANRAEEPLPVLLDGAVSGIGGPATLAIRESGSAGTTLQSRVRDHHEAVQWLFERASALLGSVEALGHRVVHGGERFQGPVRIDPKVIEELDALSELAPLHNPVSLDTIKSAQAAMNGEIPMVAVFDTAFHHGMPPQASTYAIPEDLAARHRIRRYGFHGLAHASMLEGYIALTGRPRGQLRLITLHLGSGCSAAAIRNGRSVDTSMGFTPLEGLVMATRCGDLDPAVMSYLVRREGVRAEEVEHWLNERSGLLGVSGRSKDIRDVLKAAREEQDARAALAIELFCYRARKYIGAYLAVLGGADGVLFGGGIGEHSPEVRSRICAGMDWCGLILDAKRNLAASGAATQISPEGARLPAYVIPVDEEIWIARETVRCLREH